MTPLANHFTAVYDSPDPQRVYAYSPGITSLPDGRLIATMDIGARVETGIKGFSPGAGSGAAGGGGFIRLAKIFTSDNDGGAFQHRADAPMLHGRPFAAGDAVYFLGHARDLCILQSRDRGTTWSRPQFLTSGRVFHQAPSNVWYANGRIYLVMEEVTDPSVPGWPVSVMAPIVLSARTGDDLTRAEAWTFSNALSYRAALDSAGPPRMLGVPFFKPGSTSSGSDRRNMAPAGWLETQVVQFQDPRHVWYDSSGRVLHLWLRAHTGSSNWACIARVDESAERDRLAVSVVRAPSGEPMMYVPCPGGHLKFHIVHDSVSAMFWMMSNQSTDSMRRPDRLPAERYNLPNNERHRLAIYYSRNCIDWCFAGIAADSGSPAHSRSYPAFTISGDNLHFVARSGDARAKNPHDVNMITFHTVHKFRSLIR